MAQYPTLTALPREEFGKGFARRLRRDLRIPGVIYSGNTDTVHFSVDLLEFTAVIRRDGVNAIVEFDIEGEKHLTMVKHIDQNVLTFDIDHLDMYAIKRDERVEVDVPVIIEGEPFPGTLYIQDADTLLIEADVLDIPEELVVSVEGLEADSKIHAEDLELPSGVVLKAEPDTLIVSVAFPDEEEEEEETEAAAAGEAGGEANSE